MSDRLNGEHETVAYSENRCTVTYDNRVCEHYPPHWHTATEIIMPLENDYVVNCGGTEYALAENDILIIPAGELHSMPPVTGRRIIFLCDSTALTGNPALSGLFDVMTVPILITGGDTPLSGGARRIMLEILDISGGHDELSEVMIYSKLIELFVAVKKYRSETSFKAESERYSDIFSAVVRFIDKNYARPVTLDDLAALTGYSKYHFSRIFRKYSETSFISMLNRRRLKSAETLLLEDELTVTEVAMNSGFSSLTTFNRVFKEFKGCSPTEFRKLYKNRN